MKSFFYIFTVVIISLISFIYLNNWLSGNDEPIKLTSTDFIESVEKDFKTDKYKGLTIIMSGYVTSIDNLSLVLDNKIFSLNLKSEKLCCLWTAITGVTMSQFLFRGIYTYSYPEKTVHST